MCTGSQESRYRVRVIQSTFPIIDHYLLLSINTRVVKEQTESTTHSVTAMDPNRQSIQSNGQQNPCVSLISIHYTPESHHCRKGHVGPNVGPVWGPSRIIDAAVPRVKSGSVLGAGESTVQKTKANNPKVDRKQKFRDGSNFFHPV